MYNTPTWFDEDVLRTQTEYNIKVPKSELIINLNNLDYDPSKNDPSGMIQLNGKSIYNNYGYSHEDEKDNFNYGNFHSQSLEV